MKNILKDYFTYSAGERKGVIALSLLILAVITVPRVYAFFTRTQPEDFSAFAAEIEKFESMQKSDSLANLEMKSQGRELSYVRKEMKADTPSLASVKYFDFNPNTSDDNEFRKLGLSEKQIKSIRNYLSKGGQFKIKADFKKMYCLPEKQFLSLEPYIQLPEQAVKLEYVKREFPENRKWNKDPSLVVELNSTDSSTLVKIPGVGPWTASKIIKYRNRLGGFVNKGQLLEIYGITDSLLIKFEKSFTIDPSLITKLDLNKISCDAVTKHPYMDFNLCHVLYNYRLQHGGYKTVYEIKRTALVDKEIYAKLAPYLEVK